MQKYNIAIVGATGNVGREILKILDEREFPIDEIYAIASKDSAGKEISFGMEKRLNIHALDDFDFSDVDIALFSPGASVSREYAPKAVKAGAVVIDNTSCFRMDEGVPLIVPEVNAKLLEVEKLRSNGGIIANPNCSTIQMVMALAPLHRVNKIKRIVVSTYQSVSGSGKAAMDELFNQTKNVYMNELSDNGQIYPKRIAFNVLPHIDKFMPSGYTKEEEKMMNETKKILGDDSIKITANCARVPVFLCHAEFVNIEFENAIFPDDVTNILLGESGVVTSEETDEYFTQLDCNGLDDVYVSRIHQDASIEDNRGISMWIVSDNIRKGAALNAVQIAEYLVAKGL